MDGLICNMQPAGHFLNLFQQEAFVTFGAFHMLDGLFFSTDG